MIGHVWVAKFSPKHYTKKRIVYTVYTLLFAIFSVSRSCAEANGSAVCGSAPSSSENGIPVRAPANTSRLATNVLPVRSLNFDHFPLISDLLPRSVSFEDQNFCEGQQTQLGCKPGRRLSIYSAHYGRTLNGEAMRCGRTERRKGTESAEEEEGRMGEGERTQS